MKHNILIDENIPLLHRALREAGNASLFSGRKLTCEQLAATGCEMLFVRSTTKVNSKLLRDTNVKFVATATSGFDHIDTDLLRHSGAAFYYAPGSNANSVAEYVIYSILKWSNEYNIDLKNKTIGIIGYGNIGRLVAMYAGRMGLRILLNDPPLADNSFIFPRNTEYRELKCLIEESDIITNHVPYTTMGQYRTKDLLGEAELSLVKPGSLVVQASRGGIVNEEALCKTAGTHFALSIDVWDTEPLVNTTIAKSAILATPHIAGYSRDGKIRGVAMMLSAFRDYTGLEPDTTEVNSELSMYSPLDDSLFNDYGKLLLLLEQNRQLDTDYNNLLNTLSADDMERAELFDRLRKEYPVRRETL